MKFRSLIASFVLVPGISFGAAGIYDSFVFTTTSGSAPLTFYDIGAVTANPDFDGANLGTFTVSDVLQIGGQQKSYKNNGTDVTSHSIFWRVTGVTSFASVNMPFQWNNGDSGAPSGLNNPGDQQWGGDVQGSNGTLVLSSNVLAGLAQGNYTLEVYSEITTNGVDAAGTIGNVNGGNNYQATFSVIPEPGSAALGLLGSLFLLRRRRI